jgi:hypothetical protein
MRTITVISIVAMAFPVGALAGEWKCRGVDDPSFSADQRRITREVRDYAQRKTGRIFTCFTFAGEMKDGSRYLMLDRPVDREGKPIFALGSDGTVRLDKSGKIIEYIGGR